MKVVKISNSGIYELDDYKNDEDYIKASHDGCCLVVPELWKHNKYKLAMLVEVGGNTYNPLASHLYNNLKSIKYKTNEYIYGQVYICNENDEHMIDFTIDDLKYVIKNIKLI